MMRLVRFFLLAIVFNFLYSFRERQEIMEKLWNIFLIYLLAHTAWGCYFVFSKIGEFAYVLAYSK